MRIRLADLEMARSDPAGFLSRSEDPSHFPRLSKMRDLQLAMFEYHRTRGDAVAAHVYFESMFLRHFKTTHDLQAYQERLDLYFESFEGLDHLVVEWRKNISFSLTTQVDIAGEVSRFDMVRLGGYAASCFVKEEFDWRHELRFPILQRYFAELLGATDSEVSVGCYFINFGTHEHDCFTSHQIELAISEVERLGRTIESLHQETLD